MVDVCGYELPTNLQNFTQSLNRSENIPKSFGGYFFETPCILPDKSLLLNLLFIILEYFETVPRYFSIIA